MDIRAEVWSPLQNTAVWMGAWLFGHAATDDLLDALNSLGGKQKVEDGRPFIDFLALLREETSEAPHTGEPLLRLILSGPGEAPGLPAGSEAARLVRENRTGAIVCRTADPDRHLVLIPCYQPGTTEWALVEETGTLPSPAWLSPGEADALLTEATNESARMIEESAGSTTAARLPRPRLTVGTLSDFYDTPGLPLAVPPRAAKLFARADNVAAIIETVADRAGDHSFDPQLLRLWRHIRTARTTGVAYSLQEFARAAG